MGSKVQDMGLTESHRTPDVGEAKLPLPKDHPRAGPFPVDLELWAALIPLVRCRCGKDAGA